MAIERARIDEVMAETGCDWDRALAELVAVAGHVRMAIINILNG